MAELTKEILVKIFNDVVVNQYHVPHNHPFDSSLDTNLNADSKIEDELDKICDNWDGYDL